MTLKNSRFFGAIADATYYFTLTNSSRTLHFPASQINDGSLGQLLQLFLPTAGSIASRREHSCDTGLP